MKAPQRRTSPLAAPGFDEPSQKLNLPMKVKNRMMLLVAVVILPKLVLVGLRNAE